MKLFGYVGLVLLCIGIWSHKIVAQAPVSSSATATAQAKPDTQTTEYTLPPEKLAKSKALYDLRTKLLFIGTGYSLLVLVALLSLGIAAKYRDWAERMSKWRFVQALIFVPLFMVTLTMLGLPLDAYQQHISRQYGLSVQGWGSWLGDVAKGEAVSLVMFIVVIWGVTNLIRRSPRRWWFYAWLIAMPLAVFVVYLAPLVLDPLFNNFEPLDKTNPQLVDAIERVAARAGQTIPRERIFLMDASKKVTTLNAYVTGFGPSKRIVVWDTTLKNATTPETLFVVGHEMGHYVLNHVAIGMASLAVGMFFGFYVLYMIANWAFPRFEQRWHMRSLSDWAAAPMLLLIFSILSIVADPISNSIGRQIEHNADIYGLEVTHGINPNSQEAAAHAFQTMGELGLSYPYPNNFFVFWYSDHPPIRDRVPFAHNYDPWDKGQQPKYVK